MFEKLVEYGPNGKKNQVEKQATQSKSAHEEEEFEIEPQKPELIILNFVGKLTNKNKQIITFDKVNSFRSRQHN